MLIAEVPSLTAKESLAQSDARPEQSILYRIGFVDVKRIYCRDSEFATHLRARRDGIDTARETFAPSYKRGIRGLRRLHFQIGQDFRWFCGYGRVVADYLKTAQ